MKKTVVVVVIIAITILGCGLVSGNPYRRAQEDLAKQMGLKIEDYPYETAFPEGYFYTVLEPGMSIDEVHDIVQGYEKVLHCETYSEIYYYFVSKDSSALRFKIRYDKEGKFKELQGEDTNSREINTEGCSEGLIEK